jgi:hypothetical protein
LFGRIYPCRRIKKVAGHQHADPAHTNPLLLAELDEFWEILARLAAQLGPPRPAILTAVRGGAKLVEVARELDLDVNVVGATGTNSLRKWPSAFASRTCRSAF